MCGLTAGRAAVGGGGTSADWHACGSAAASGLVRRLLCRAAEPGLLCSP